MNTNKNENRKSEDTLSQHFLKLLTESDYRFFIIGWLDTTPFTVFGPRGEVLGFVTFVLEFKYLGSLVHHSLTSDADVNKRIKAASAAFGALRSVLFIFVLSETLRGRCTRPSC